MSPNPAILTWPRPSGPGEVTAAYRASYVSAADGTSYTFTAADLGAAAAGRTIVVGIVYRSAASVTVTGVTIGGVSASVDLNNVQSVNSAFSEMAIARAAVPTGATGDVVVTLSGTAVRCGLAVWRADGPVAVSDTDSTASAVGTGSITVPAGGFAVACAYVQAASVTWEGITTAPAATALGESSALIVAARTASVGAITWGINKTATSDSTAQGAVAYAAA